LRDADYIEGQNLSIEYRSSAGKYERLAALAAELVRLKVDVIVVPAGQNALAAKQATRTIPIVVVTGDPLAGGLVASLARPGGNITGLSSVVNPEIAGKQLHLLKEIVPQVSRVALPHNPGNPAHPPGLRAAERAAPSLAIQLQPLEARTPEDIAKAFAAMTRKRAGAVLIFGDGMFGLQQTRIADLAVKGRLPTVHGSRPMVTAGGLMSYGPNSADLFRRAATYVDKILKGAKPADLPVEQPTMFELVINLKTAKALGLAIPQSLLQRADEIIR
jgi:putative tryptophan/tyrosine transport system substrate-binding protein